MYKAYYYILLYKTYIQFRYSINTSKRVYLKVYNGVKQGGVMSPILLGIYSDELLCKLKHCGYALPPCRICKIFGGTSAYADDATLLYRFKQGLSKMLNIAAEFF